MINPPALFCFQLVLLFAVALSTPTTASAANATIAVAANFAEPAKALAREFNASRDSNSHTQIVVGSSGKIFAQISHGAPYHGFLSADQARVDALVKTDLAIPASRFTYAIGRLALWVPGMKPDVSSVAEVKRITIANPRFAPYGKAAQQILDGLDLQPPPQLITGENVAQAYHFVHSGNAEAGFVALSQVIGKDSEIWLVPEHLHEPVLQDAVLIKSANTAAAATALAFFDYLKSPAAELVLNQFGYKPGTTL